MIIDNQLRLANGQVLTTGGGSATTGGSAIQAATNTVDLSVARDVGPGQFGLQASVLFGGSQLVLSQTFAAFQILIVADVSDPSAFGATVEVIGASPIWGNTGGWGASPVNLNNATTPRPGTRINIPLMPMTQFIDPTTGRLVAVGDTGSINPVTVMPHPRRFVTAYYLLTAIGSATAAQITTSPTFTIDIGPVADHGARVYPTQNPMNAGAGATGA